MAYNRNFRQNEYEDDDDDREDNIYQVTASQYGGASRSGAKQPDYQRYSQDDEEEENTQSRYRTDNVDDAVGYQQDDQPDDDDDANRSDDEPNTLKSRQNTRGQGRDEDEDEDRDQDEDEDTEVPDSRPSVIARTKSDPLPSQQEERDKADADYHPEIVMLTDDSGDDEIKFTATLDSGCDDNWISWSKMEEHRVGVDDVEALPEGETAGNVSSVFTDFSGNDVKPAGQVELRWRASGSGRSETTIFYVIDNENAPFDALFGRTFMDTHDGGPNFFKKPVLINAGKPLTPAEKARKDLGVHGTSAFQSPPEEKEIEDGDEQAAGIAQDEADEPVPVVQEKTHGFSKWGSKLSSHFSKLHT